MPGSDGIAAARLRALPQVQRLLERPEAAALIGASSRAAVAAALRTALAEARTALRRPGAAEPPSPQALLTRAGAVLAAARQPALCRVINATGIVLHTNLGRAPLAAAALDAVVAAARGYSNLEFDLARGLRGSRHQCVQSLLHQLTGAEAALVVNNNAAAMLLALSALAAGGEVIVSRGELVEIGGGFRVPDVVRQGGARLVEVGTTNKTRLADYREAITPQTRLLMKVHQSNYRLVGFTAAVGLPALAELARAHDLLLVEDLGSGSLADLRRVGRPYEPTVREALTAGADLVAFSGDKLLGGPQAGILVGREAAVAPLRRHPLLRAVRPDKLSLAALEATLRLSLDDEVAARAIPVRRMLAQTEAALRGRAARLAAALHGDIAAAVVPTAGYAGGGTLPGAEIPSVAVRLVSPGCGAEELASRLRHAAPPVIGRIADGALLLDMLAVADEELDEVAAAVRRATG